jgi:hypothetical protein
MSFYPRPDIEGFARGFELLQLDEENHPGTKLGEPRHWHIFHILTRRSA